MGVAVALGWTPQLAGVGLLTIAFYLGLRDWRWSVYGLILYVPIAGIPYIASYPDTTWPVLAKDLLFVLPAYAGFIGTIVWRREMFPVDRGMLTLFGLLSLLVLAQVFNPTSANLRVGAIGAKVWLLYLPMYFLGYAIVQTRRDLMRLFGLLSISAIVPALIGVGEALLIYSGHERMVYDRYGAAADVATQHFAAISYAAGHAIRRVPSTFTYGAQFYGFLATIVAVSWAWWRGFLVGTRWSRVGAALWVLTVVAALLTGQLGAFIFIPVLIVAMLMLNGPRELLSPRYVVLGTMAATGISTVIGAAFGTDLIREAVQTGIWEFNLLFIEGLSQSFSKAILGLGAGTDTGASRYAFATPTAFTATQEAWYVKALLELGVAGLMLVSILLLTLLVRALRRHYAIEDRRLRVASAAIIAFVIWNMIYNVKSSFMDLDPINIYFWLLTGVLAKVAVLSGDASPSPVPAVTPAGRPPTIRPPRTALRRT